MPDTRFCANIILGGEAGGKGAYSAKRAVMQALIIQKSIEIP